MNRLEHNDACIPTSYEENLKIYKILMDKGLRSYRTYEDRVEQGVKLYNEYRGICWDINNEYVTGFDLSHLHRYNVMSVREFLIKAGEIRTYTKGTIKHIFE